MRLLADTIQYRIVAFTVDNLILWAVTGAFWQATSVAVLLLLVKTVVYYTWHKHRGTP